MLLHAVVMLAILSVFAPSAFSDAPLTQGFEDGAPAWSETGMWHVQANPETISVIPAIDQLVDLPDSGQLPAAFQGVRAAWFGEAATGTYCGADFATINQPPGGDCISTQDQSGQLTSPPFSLAGRSAAFLTFHAWWEVEGLRSGLTDLMQVQYSTDGGTVWSTAATLDPFDLNFDDSHDSRMSGGWQTYKVDISKAAGAANVRVRFVFDSVDRFRNGFRGLLVDGVGVVDPAGAPVSEPGGSGTFTDAEPVLSVTGAELVQAPDGSWEVHFTVEASHPVAHPVDFDWTVLGQAGEQAASGHGTLAPGQTRVDISVPVSGSDSPYTASLSSAGGAVIDATASSAVTAPVTALATAPVPASPGLPPTGPPGPGVVGNPVFKTSFGLGTVSGTVLYRVPGGKYVPLTGAVTLPLGSVVDATKGHALIAVQSDAQGTVQTVEVWEGKAGIFQSGKPAVAELRLAGGNFSRCGKSSRTRARASGSPTIRRLWATGKGRFRTKGRYASATVRGTYWMTADLCSATRVTVKKGIVAVADFRRHRTVNVRAGHSVTISALRTGRYRNRRGNNPPRLS